MSINKLDILQNDCNIILLAILEHFLWPLPNIFWELGHHLTAGENREFQDPQSAILCDRKTFSLAARDNILRFGESATGA